MLKPGIKIGPKDWKSRLEKSNARYCEVWFRIDRANLYKQMFDYLVQEKIDTGLHFWGVVDNTWEPNISYPGKNLRSSISLIKECIDIAAKYKFHYVNIHCGNRALIKLDLDHQLFVPDKNFPIISLEQAERVQEKSLKILNSYAQKKKVLLLTETIIPKTSKVSLNHPRARLSVTDYFAVPVKSLIKQAESLNLFITNDICHTFADDFDKPLNILWKALWQKSKALAPYTKLLHINTVTPPYNGTDSHHGITNKDYQIPGTFPTRRKLKKLLNLFKHRSDVWVIGEPSSHHVENFRSLVNLLQ